MDPDYRNYLEHYLQEQGIELPLLDENEEEEAEEDDDEDEDEDEEEEEEEDYGGDADLDGRSGTTLRQVLYGNQRNDINSVETIIVDGQASETAHDVVILETERECSSRGMDNNESTGGGTASLKGDNDEENEGELNMGDTDGLCCPICFEAWSSGGDHNVCCLPCGHIYGLSCIKKWMRRRGSSKCPQCKKKCGIKDIRLLYASRIVAIDGELQKRVRSLEAKCVSLENKSSDWSKKEVEWKKREADLRKQVRYLTERTRDLEDLLEDAERRASGSFACSLNGREQPTLGSSSSPCLDASPKSHMRGCSNKFIPQKDFQVAGARLFDIDSSSQFVVIARRLSGSGGAHVLTKVSLLSGHDKEDSRLPENTKAVKDLRVSPDARLVLLASLGKKLSILSMESNNTILTYHLPAAAWSCSWDICSAHYIYAGLQNGALLQFDMRHTMRPVESLNGLTCNPIHTLHSLSPNSSLNSGVRSVLTASSLGLCQWNFGGSGERPCLIPESDKQGVCISLAYCKSTDDIVASYRPKIEMSGDLEISQRTLTAPGQAALGSHVLFRKMGCAYQKLGATCANVSGIRLPKSAIIDGVHHYPLFASGDELTCELALQELPSLMSVERLKPQKYPIHDVKYIRFSSSGLLGCLSEDSLQLFTAQLL